MILPNSSNQNKRLLGIDLFRGIAAYGVVFIHGLGEIPRNQNALLISNFFVAFCVPFFLVTSFYFSIKLLLSTSTSNYLNNRLKKIIIPYFAWTVIYLLARLFGWLIGNRESFEKLIADPINIIFFGASGVQLYFLPMLFCGTVAAIPVTKVFKNIQNISLLFLFLFLSIGLVELIVKAGNDFVLGEGIAFKQIIYFLSVSNSWLFQLMRLVFVILVWIIKCLPYIIFNIIINHYQSQKFLQKYIDICYQEKSIRLIILLIPLLISIIYIYNIQVIFWLIPYILLIYAIVISELISKSAPISWIAKKVGYLSFGIYLVHALITAGFLPVIAKFYPKIITIQLTVLILIVSSLLIFFISVMIIRLILLNKNAAKILLAIY
ncbi:MAG: acyltransferase family protein [Nostoc sp.]|uniref:acyltransferase family protein n=1 Tax=Nostoc sp. TaxID=1180 RepID=UPI002FF588A5